MRPLLLLAALGVAGCATTTDTASFDPVAALAGTWQVIDGDGKVTLPCAEGQHFEPSADRRIVRLTELGDSDLRATYRVLSNDRAGALMEIENEERLTASGKPVKWWPVFDGPDQFRWRRDDWPRDTSTAARWVRCQ